MIKSLRFSLKAGLLILGATIFSLSSWAGLAEKAIVIKSQAELKLLPEYGSKTIKILPLGTEVEAAERRDNWVRVILAPDKDGFVISGFLPAADIGPPAKRPSPLSPAVAAAEPRPALVVLEIWGGFATLDPADLNLRADYEEKYSAFDYDQFYSYHQAAGHLLQLSRAQEGGLARISNGLPFGGWLKLHIGRRAALSLGLRYLSKIQTSERMLSYNAIWTVPRIWQENIQEQLQPFTLSVEAVIPQLGVHYAVLKSDVDLEAYALVGPLFSKCSYTLEWDNVYDDGWNHSHQCMTIEEKGTGTGVSVESGIRVSAHFSPHAGIFLEAGYAHQMVKRLNEPGRSELIINGTTTSNEWTGDWVIKERIYQESWGQTSLQFPSNFNGDYSPILLRVRDFRLDLSGWQVRMGFLIAF